MAIIIGKLIPLVIPRIWLMCLLSITYHWNDWQLQYSNNQFIIIFLKRAQYIFNYYSFEKYPRFWVGKTTRIIHHNQPLLTKFGKNFVILNQWRQKLCHIEPMTSKWRQKCSPVTVIEPLTWGRGCVIFGEQKYKEWNGDNFSAIWFLIEQFKCQGNARTDWEPGKGFWAQDQHFYSPWFLHKPTKSHLLSPEGRTWRPREDPVRMIVITVTRFSNLIGYHQVPF